MDKLDQLLEKYLQQKLTFQEQHQLAKWLEEDEDNRKTIQLLETFWRDHSIDFEEKEKRVKARLFDRIEKKSSSKKSASIKWSNSMIKVAAIILLCLTTIFSIYTLSTNKLETENPVSFMEKKSGLGEKKTIKLPDGSSVKLNSGSIIRYPESFIEENRVVELEGEGFFEVVRNVDKPFIVHADKAMIKVLGTSFNVNSDGTTNNVVVSVRSGQVKVSNQSENISRILNPNELIIFDNDDEQMELRKIDDDQLIFGWTNQILVFNDNSANEVFRVVANWFGVEFILEKNIDRNRVFTSRFENPTLKSVLESLSYVYDFKYEINGKTIIIK